MVEVTSKSSKKLVGALKDISNTEREMENKKIEVYLSMFEQNMEYKKERDRQAKDNAKLSLLNQQLAVQALNKMAEAFGRSF